MSESSDPLAQRLPSAQTEEAFFFENEGKKLFGVLHVPPEPARRLGLVVCDPFGEEKQLVQRLLATVARHLSNRGIHVLRFDYRGYGDSEGEFEDASLQDQLSDIRRAVDILADQAGIEDVGLLGLRLGGTLAALAAQADSRIGFLVLWAPIVRPKLYFGELFRRLLVSNVIQNTGIRTREDLLESLNTSGQIALDGDIVTKHALLAYENIDLLDHDWRFAGDVLVVDVSDSRKRSEPLERLFFKCGRHGTRSQLRIVQEEPFWTVPSFRKGFFPREVHRETLEWLLGEMSTEEQTSGAAR